jgi:predicted DNA-binding protein YlxM (UPF0122 family)
MFKIIIFIIGLVALQSVSHAVDCNYNILRMEAATYSGKVIEHIPATPETIRKSLTFLSSSNDTNPQVNDKYSKVNFEKLCAKTKELDCSHAFLQEFIQNCSTIFNANDASSLDRQSIYMLLERTNQTLEEYFDTIQFFEITPIENTIAESAKNIVKEEASPKIIPIIEKKKQLRQM